MFVRVCVWGGHCCANVAVEEGPSPSQPALSQSEHLLKLFIVFAILLKMPTTPHHQIASPLDAPPAHSLRPALLNGRRACKCQRLRLRLGPGSSDRPLDCVRHGHPAPPHPQIFVMKFQAQRITPGLQQASSSAKETPQNTREGTLSTCRNRSSISCFVFCPFLFSLLFGSRSTSPWGSKTTLSLRVNCTILSFFCVL